MGDSLASTKETWQGHLLHQSHEPRHTCLCGWLSRGLRRAETRTNWLAGLLSFWLTAAAGCKQGREQRKRRVWRTCKPSDSHKHSSHFLFTTAPQSILRRAVFKKFLLIPVLFQLSRPFQHSQLLLHFSALSSMEFRRSAKSSKIHRFSSFPPR
jgi:hypothetical protein